MAQGWARKNVGRSSTKFTEAQVNFLRDMFNAHMNGGHKVRESEAHERMTTTFTDLNPESVYSKQLVLTVAQIKSWFSQEASRKKRLAAKEVIERGVTELVVDQDVSEGDKVTQEVVDEGGEGAGHGFEVRNVEEGKGVEEGEREGPARMEVEVEVESTMLVAEEPSLVGAQGEMLITGALYVVVREEWQDEKGFEVWELEEDAGIVLEDHDMISSKRGRKWVHDTTLMDDLSRSEIAHDLPDKKGGLRLGKKNERRFAPSEGRRWSDFADIQPAQWGHVWLRIDGVKLEKYGQRGRVSFVFATQEERVNSAYALLDKLVEEDT